MLKASAILVAVRTSIYADKEKISDADLLSIIESKLSEIGSKNKFHSVVTYHSVLAALKQLINAGGDNAPIYQKLHNNYSKGLSNVIGVPLQTEE